MGSRRSIRALTHEPSAYEVPTGGALELPKLALSAEIAVGALGRECGLAEGGAYHCSFRVRTDLFLKVLVIISLRTLMPLYKVTHCRAWCRVRPDVQDTLRPLNGRA